MSAAPPAKAFLLAGGLGTRLRPLTDATPKCLVPVGGRPMLHWWLLICERLGVKEVLLNTHHLAEQVRAFVRARATSMKVTLFHEERLLGTAGTLAANRGFVEGQRDFWIFYADTLVGAEMSPMVALHRTRGADLTLGVFRSPEPKSGGVVELADGGDSDTTGLGFLKGTSHLRNISERLTFVTISRIYIGLLGISHEHLPISAQCCDAHRAK